MWKRPFRTLVAIWAVTTIVVVPMGPFGTFEGMPLVDRAVYWGTIIALAIVLVGIIRQTILALAKRPMHPFALDLILLPVFTIIYTPILFWLTREITTRVPVFSFVETGLVVLSVSVVLIGLREAFHLHAPGVRQVSDEVEEPALAPTTAPVDAPTSAEQGAKVETSAPEMPPQTVVQEPPPLTGVTPLIERLPTECQGELHCISGRDHYVDITTENGSASVLLRFSDALREVSGCAGMQVHRSHWVADAAVTGLRRDAHRLFVQLRSGAELPVSRPHAKDARSRWG